MVQIEIRSGPEAGRVVELGPGTHVLGRQKGCDLTLADTAVSGRHVELQVAEDGTVRFRDLGSTNGTWSGGVQVEDGEWFPGSEIKLGSLVLRHVDSDLAGAVAGEDDDADAEVHRRARAAAMEGGGRGGLWLVLIALVLVAGGGAAWWFLFRDAGTPTGGGAVAAGGGGNVTTQELDAIDALGDFATPDDWVLADGLSIADGRLVARGAGGRATLTPEFPVTAGALRIEAQVEGARVHPVVSFTVGEGDADARWQGPDLAGGAVTLALPEGAARFRLALQVQGAGSVRGLRVDAEDGRATRLTAPFATVWHDGGNLWMADGDDTLLAVQGPAGSWSGDAGGLVYTAPEGGGTLRVRASAELSGEGPLMVLAEGGPVGLAAGGSVDGSPGWMVGGGARRLLATLTPEARVQGTEDGLELRPTGTLDLRWELTEALTNAARLAGEIRSGRLAGDDRRVLEAAARLLRLYPLEQEEVTLALTARQEVIERGRARLDDLEIAAGGALFVSALATMEELEERASALAASYPGTGIERDARDLAAVLRQAANGLREERERARAAYRERLDAALVDAYPAIAAWLNREES